MELGEKIKTARLEAGFSQRQLCGEVITRNMLSQIEHGAARPSMDTLRYLATRLGKSVSFFLEEQVVTSPNQEVMAQARILFGQGSHCEALELLEGYQGPDPVFDQEYHLLLALCLMDRAEQAIREERLPFAQALLTQAEAAAGETAYFIPALERQRLLLLAQASPAPVDLPADDRELLVRAQWAMAKGMPDRAAAYLDAAEDRESPRWCLLRGEACFAGNDYAQAAACFHRAEDQFPQQTAPRLEACYRELGDFKRAYEYACRQR